jgi:hypothetical protein
VRASICFSSDWGSEVSPSAGIVSVFVASVLLCSCTSTSHSTAAKPTFGRTSVSPTVAPVHAPNPVDILRRVPGCVVITGPQGVEIPGYRMADCYVPNPTGDLGPPEVWVWTQDPAHPGQPQQRMGAGPGTRIIIGKDFYMAVLDDFDVPSAQAKAEGRLHAIATEVAGQVAK